MNKIRWGNKLTCHSCGVKFYDLKKKIITCPKCDTPYKEEKVKSRRTVTPDIPKPTTEQVKETKSDEDIPEVKLEDDILDTDDEDILDAEDDKVQDVTIMEDTSDIGGDDEDIGEVIGVVDNNGDKD